MSLLKMYILVGPKKVKIGEQEYIWEPRKELNYHVMRCIDNIPSPFYIRDVEFLETFGWKLPEDIKCRGTVKIWSVNKRSMLLEIPHHPYNLKTMGRKMRRKLYASPATIGYWVVSKVSRAQKIDIKSTLGKKVFKNATGMDFKKRNKEV